MSRIKLEVGIPAKLAKQKQCQAKLAALADKKAEGQLTLDDVDAKLDVIIEMLQDLMLPK